MPYVQLQSAGTDLWQGPLLDHPGHLLVHVRATSPDTYTVTLWYPIDDDTRNPCGSGTLRREGGRVVGQCSEWSAVWHVAGICGESRLEFSEGAPG